VFCTPATGQESQGIVLLEAMACGTPVVASNIEGFASVVTHNEEGLLVSPKDEEKLALALLHLLVDKELRTEMGQRALMTAQFYSWKRISEKVISYYERLLDTRRTPEGKGGPLHVKSKGQSRWRVLVPGFARRRLTPTRSG